MNLSYKSVIHVAGPVYQPTIKPNELFYAVSAFLYSFKTLNVISDNGTFSPAELKVKAKQYCSTVTTFSRNVPSTSA